jgi:NADPH:quinone reductase-like Zn-dependent oxidoreductase
MKAFALETTDRPANLTTIPRPDVGPGDVLVAVRAASINGIDVYQASGALLGMMEHTLPTVVGRDFAGVVEAVGSDVSDVAAGDEVFGFVPSRPPMRSGTFAEYLSGGSELVLAHKPAGLGFLEAAALPLAGSAAIDLLDAIDGTAGDVVLVVGATGGVGALVVQLAAQRGLVVVATARPDEDAFVRALGASDTIDYSASGVADAVRTHYPDGIARLIDLVNRQDALAELAAVVRSGGNVASLLSAADVDGLRTRGITGSNVMAAPTRDKLNQLGALAASGKLRVPIQSTFSLDRTADALAAFQQGTHGKLVLRVGAD